MADEAADQPGKSGALRVERERRSIYHFAAYLIYPYIHTSGYSPVLNISMQNLNDFDLFFRSKCLFSIYYIIIGY